MSRITQLYAYVIADKDEDDEGVPAIMMGDTFMPLIGADLDRATSLRKVAQGIANQYGKPVKLIRSTDIEIVEVLVPASSSERES